MRGRHVLRKTRTKKPELTELCVPVLAFCFLLGAFCGRLYAAGCDGAVATSLSDYIRDYCAVSKSDSAAISFRQCIVPFFGYTVAVFLCGFSALGTLLIPALAGVYGFFTVFTVSCFGRAFGRTGVVLAAALLMIRLLFTLPCFFSLAGRSDPVPALPPSRPACMGVASPHRHLAGSQEYSPDT